MKTIKKGDFSPIVITSSLKDTKDEWLIGGCYSS